MRQARDSRHSSADAATYKQGMRRLASGVVVVTTAHEGRRSGLVMTGLSSVSADPPVLLICVNQSSSSHDPIARSECFCVNILRHDHSEIAARFASPQLRETRFADGDWRALATGAPALVDCLASFDCVVTNAVGAGTHTVFFGKVVDVKLWADDIRPLLYWDGDYRLAAATGSS
jgi:flavin reductase